MAPSGLIRGSSPVGWPVAGDQKEVVCRESRFPEPRAAGICVETSGPCGNVSSCVPERARGAVGTGASPLTRTPISPGAWVRSTSAPRSEALWGFPFCPSVSWKVWPEPGRATVSELEKERTARALALREPAGRGGKRTASRPSGLVSSLSSASCPDRWASGVCSFSHCERRGRLCPVSALLRADRRREATWWQRHVSPPRARVSQKESGRPLQWLPDAPRADPPESWGAPAQPGVSRGRPSRVGVVGRRTLSQAGGLWGGGRLPSRVTRVAERPRLNPGGGGGGPWERRARSPLLTPHPPASATHHTHTHPPTPPPPPTHHHHHYPANTVPDPTVPVGRGPLASRSSWPLGDLGERALPWCGGDGLGPVPTLGESAKVSGRPGEPRIRG